MIEGHPSVPNISNGAAVGATQKEKIMFNTKEDEEQVLHSLIELNKSFTDLEIEVRTAFDEKEASDPKLLINLTRWIEAYMNWNDKLTNASLNETFKIIQPFYDFIDCNLIVDVSEKFLKGVTFGDEEKLNIVSELQNHKKKADTFRFSTNVAHLHKSLMEIYQEHIPDLTNMPHIIIKLQNPWYVELLLKEQIDSDVQNKDGVTALMVASANGHYEVVKLLLEWKADPTIKSNEGHTALFYAKTEEISVLLQQVDDAISVSSCTSSVLSLVM
ncbi:PREDICTED: uncharacterized protein LOC105315435 [Amphimedon queenslandica]|uniref:Death domain-containing protein n=1 Tax=Amphimedon queenslandica TaxID=400682 RepID=A0AAN0IRF3_AMPQE|nr:PREDICTED: uncharacterized protein LOC105315435 [Amphimedon queenslandica]|eukprot:XP_011408392.1 PREDICTED: uncharacterized protein LOC105315435 [Amphimedon queenslandica]